MVSKRERLNEILRRLAAAPPASSHDEALELIAVIMNAVEDELSGEPYDPVDASTMKASARMYRPLADSKGPAILPGVTPYRASRHRILIASNGAILIRHIDGTVELSKPAADGSEVPS